MINYQFVKNRLIFTLLTIVSILIDSCRSDDKCPRFQCSPEIASLDSNSINTTFDIKCTFTESITESSIMWKFNLGKSERIINDFDGGILAPFRHQFIVLNNTNGPISAISILKVNLINASYFTNYTIMNIADMCQRTVKIHLQQRALGYTNECSKGIFNLFLLLVSLVFSTLITIR